MKVCQYCGKTLPKKPPSQQLKFCSMKCMGLARRTLPTEKTCQWCGKRWEPKTRFQAARSKTCSRKCGAKLARQTSPTPKKPRPICQSCGQRFEPKSNTGISRAKYCSYQCAGTAKSQDPKMRAHLKAIANNGKDKKRPGKGMGGEKNPAWKGGVTYRRGKGNYRGPKYVRCPQEYLPMARKDGYIMEHRLVMAKYLKRLLVRTEVVHHIDHDPRNNMIENLQLYSSNGEHKRAEGAAKRSYLKD